MSTTTENNPTAEPGFATVEDLLDQVPEPLRTRLYGAIAADQVRTYSAGLRHAASNALQAMEAELARITRPACRPWCVDHIETTADGDICNGETITLNFDGPNHIAAHSNGASLGLTYSPTEGDNAFVDVGSGPEYMAVDDLRALALAALKLTGGA